MAADHFRQVVHLSDAKRSELLRRLDDLAREHPVVQKETPEEPLPQTASVRATIHHPGGGVGRFLVVGRFLTSNGMWFLHSGFLHPGTRCVFAVPRGTRQEGGVMGEVKWCEHFERGLHAVGVKFDEEIDPRLLLSPAGNAAAVEERASLELPRLKGRILLLDDQQVDCELLSFHLRSTGITIITVASVQEAVNQVRTTPFDVVICDLNLSEMTGEAAMRTLRKNGFLGPMIVLTGESSINRLKQAKRDGAFAVLEKPYSPANLIRVLAGALAKADQLRAAAMGPGSDMPIQSSMAVEQSMRPMIVRYVEQARKMAEDLERAVHENEYETVRRICVSLKGSGAGYGFEPVSRQAELAVRALDASLNVGESLDALTTLESMVRRLVMPGEALRSEQRPPQSQVA